MSNNWSYEAISSYIFTIFSWNLQEEFINTIINVINGFVTEPFQIQYGTPKSVQKQHEDQLLTITKEKKNKKKGKKTKKTINSKKVNEDVLNRLFEDLSEDEPIQSIVTTKIQPQEMDNETSLDEEIDIYLAVQIFEVIMKLYIDQYVSLILCHH